MIATTVLLLGYILILRIIKYGLSQKKSKRVKSKLQFISSNFLHVESSYNEKSKWGVSMVVFKNTWPLTLPWNEDIYLYLYV